MDGETVETLVIGGGQAGIAMGEHLGRHGLPHLILERADRRTLALGTLGFAGCQWPGMATVFRARPLNAPA
jgi:2-polyprenyl-6-methoxyphenol hydroxylase-like FAD-dependent oxidoreductase